MYVHFPMKNEKVRFKGDLPIINSNFSDQRTFLQRQYRLQRHFRSFGPCVVVSGFDCRGRGCAFFGTLMTVVNQIFYQRTSVTLFGRWLGCLRTILILKVLVITVKDAGFNAESKSWSKLNMFWDCGNVWNYVNILTY